AGRELRDATAAQTGGSGTQRVVEPAQKQDRAARARSRPLAARARGDRAGARIAAHLRSEHEGAVPGYSANAGEAKARDGNRRDGLAGSLGASGKQRVKRFAR